MTLPCVRVHVLAIRWGLVRPYCDGARLLSGHMCQFRNQPILISNLLGKLVLLRQLFQRVADDSPRIHLFLGSIPRVRMTDANSAGQGLREDETDSA